MSNLIQQHPSPNPISNQNPVTYNTDNDTLLSPQHTFENLQEPNPNINDTQHD